jgi:nucleoside-diphosphate-sugar epimerase
MRVLITGDQGFVGAATRAKLEADGDTVIGFDVMDHGDIRDLAQLYRVVEATGPDRILHLAAISRFAEADHDPWLAHETNVIGSTNIAEIAAKVHIPVAYASTGSVYMPIKQAPPITEEFPAYGNSVYGCTKYLGELAIRRSAAPWIVLRYAHLYGSEKRLHGLVGGFLERMERGLSPTLYGGHQSNDFTYIDDVVQANVLALRAPWDKWHQIYNIGTGEELTTEQAAELIVEVFEYEGEITRIEQRTVDPDRFVYDCSKASRMLGFTARYGFREGLGLMRNERLKVLAVAA